MNESLLEFANPTPGFGPINIGTARTGDVISLKNYRRCLVLFYKDAGANNEDVTLGLQQAKSVAPSSAKDLNFTEVFTKQGTLTSIGTFTRVTKSASASYTNTDAGGQAAIWAIDVKADDLDLDNGYDCIYATTTDAGTATSLGALLYIPYYPRYKPPLSAIAD